MTGFASLTYEDQGATIDVTIKTVNHRFLDMQLRLPQWLTEIEPRVRAAVQRALSRGRAEVTVSVQLRRAPAPTVELNLEFVSLLATALEQARAQGAVHGTLTPGDLLRIPQAVTIRDRPLDDDPEQVARVALGVEAAVERALQALTAMRDREGRLLRADLDARQSTLGALIARAEELADAGRAAVEERLRERVRSLSAEVQADPVAVAQEIVRTAARSDITEEVTRFRAHLTHWAALSDSEEPCGRKLDFLLQEMNREVNTVGSKADGLHVSEVVIDAKAELEKMREQVQNVE